MIGKLFDGLFGYVCGGIAFVILFTVAWKFWPYLLFALVLVVVWNLENAYNRKKQNRH